MSKKIFSLLLVVALLLGCLTSCAVINWVKNLFKPDVEETVDTKVQYNTTTSVMPSNWNELTYADNNDTQIMSYIGSSFFSYDYKFENDQKFLADGSLNKDGIVDGAFTTNFDAATKLEDVTASVDAKWGYTAEQKAEGGYAWKITLRDDLKWHDGTSITAADFVYSMKAQLDPAFMNFRAKTYYDTLKVKGAKAYFYSGAPIYTQWVNWSDSAGVVDTITETTVKDGLVYVTINGEEQLVYTSTTDANILFGTSWGMIHTDYGYGPAGYFYKEYTGDTSNPDALPSYVVAVKVENEDGSTDTVYYEDLYYKYSGTENEFGYIPVTPEILEDLKVLAANFASFGSAGEGGWNAFASYLSGYGDKVDFETTVGMFEVPGENAFVICLDAPQSFLNADGSLSVWSAYYMASLPLVHKGLYEANKVAPKEGSTLWTSTYNSSLTSTASWGPYMLTEFEAGSHYKLEKNPYWYGWKLDTNKGQYKIDTIYCRKVEESNTAWMGFLKGEFDDASLTTENVGEYLDSKYVTFSEGSTGTYGMQLFSDLSVLKTSDNNNGILAIAEFRQAFNLALNRSDIIEQIWPGTATPCFGLVNVAYYYDIENAANLYSGGKYRNTVEAKEGILRAYGYTQAADGTWSINDLTGMTRDEAYSTLTGYNFDLAKVRMQEAIAELTANAGHYGYDSTKDITLVYGSSLDNDKQRFRANYLQNVLNDLTAGTALEGKIKVKFDASAGSQWAEAFRSGKTQIGFGYGFSGNPFNPFDIVGAFVNPDDSLNYHQYWDTSAVELTLTMPEIADWEFSGQELTMSVQNWYFCLNSLAESENQPVKHNFGAGFAPTEARLVILAALEEVAIKECRSIMLIADSGGSFLGAKFSYFSDSYNTFMGFGGIRYMEVNYNNSEWAAYVASMGGDLSAEYKKSE